MIDITHIEKLLTIEEYHIYQNPLFQPFIQCYLKYKNDCTEYKLFDGYCFRFSYLCELYKQRIYVDDSYLTKTGKLDFRKPKVKNDFFRHNIHYFIGLTDQLSPIFVYLSELEDHYYYSGFLNPGKSCQYQYLTEDKKYVNTLKNLKIDTIEKTQYNYIDKKWEDNPIYILSNKTKEILNKKGSLL